MKTYKPKLIIISTEELINKIKVKADSILGPSCQAGLDYTETQACGIYADVDSSPGGGHNNMCVEIGPLFGCNKYGILSCSTSITPIL